MYESGEQYSTYLGSGSHYAGQVLIYNWELSNLEDIDWTPEIDIQSDDDLLVLDDPRLVVQGPEGQMGFARGICQTGVENPTEIAFNDFMFITPCNEEVENAYRQATSGLVVPDSKIKT